MKTFRTFAFVVLWLATAGLSNPAHSQWAIDGNRICDAPGDQHEIAIDSDGAGGAILVWRDERLNDANIYGQRIDVGGALIWPGEFSDDGMVICGADGTQGSPSVSGDGAGGAWVTWGDNRDTSQQIFAQRISHDGSPQWFADGRFVNWGAGGPGIVFDGVNGAFIYWEEAATYPSSVAIQRMNSYGSLQWGSYVVAGRGYNLSGVLDGAGGLVMGWQRSYVGFFDNYIKGQRVDGAGAVQWAGNAVSPGHGCTMNARIAPDGSGGGLWAYTCGSSFVAQKVDSSGNLAWGPNGIDPFPGLVPQDDGSTAIVSDGAGGAIVLALDDALDVYASRIGPSGNLLWITNVCVDPSAQYDPQIVSDGQGGAYLAWQDARNYGVSGQDIYVEHLDDTGELLWAQSGTAICSAAGSQGSIRMTATGSSAIVAWTDPRNYGATGLDIYAQALHIDGSIGDPPIRTTMLSPMGNTAGVAATTNIAIQFAAAVAPATDWNASLLVHGSLHGSYSGSFSYDGASRIVTFNPATDFAPGEVVTVTLTSGILSQSGDALSPFSYDFSIASAVSPPYFPVTTSTNLDVGVRGICAADLNGDRIIDLAVSNSDSNTVACLLGSGDGTFVIDATWPTGSGPVHVTAADLDNDGDIDLVTTDRLGNTFSVLLNQGSASFAAPVPVPVGSDPRNTVACDFDGDGFLDLATSNYAAGLYGPGVSVHLNDGTGHFSAGADYPTGTSCSLVGAGDVNGDGAMDIVGTDESSSAWVRLNKGGGSFAAPLNFGTSLLRVFALADLDGDRDLDLGALVNLGLAGAELRVFDGNGDGTFAAGYDTYPLARGASPCLAYDVDGNSALDLIHGWGSGPTIWVGLNDGAGTFNPMDAAAGTRQSSIAVADFNGDGTLDLASTDRFTGLLWITLNRLDLTAVNGTPITRTRLEANVPNPFNPTTRIDYTLSRDGHVRLTIFDARGHAVATLVDEHQQPRRYSVIWDGRDSSGRGVASGIYYCRLSANGIEETRKMALVR